MSERRARVDQLQVGVFIRLELKWYEHPFTLSSFKIKSDDQIRTLRELGLRDVIYVPEKSDRQPLAKKPEAEPPPVVPPRRDPELERLQTLKKERIVRLKERNKRIQRCEKQYEKNCAGLKSVMQNLASGSEEALAAADSLVQNMVDTLLSEKEVIVHLLNVKAKDEGVYHHVMNVSILAMLLGKERRLDASTMRWLGLGALFHDIGKVRIPKKILYKKPPLTTAERKLIELHPVYGEELLGRREDFPKEALEVVRQHHETNDGKGYPDGLKADRISLPAKITSIADIYDNYCNPIDPAEAMTPHEALSYMFARMQSRLDVQLLALFIKSMGIYPPGTVVQLSNDALGIVASLNTKNQMKPNVLIYDPHVPRNEAIILDMEEDADIAIVKSIRPSQLPLDVYAYLNPRASMSYYIEAVEPSGAGAPS